MDRKTFIKSLTGVVLVGVPILTVLACGGTDDEGFNDPPDTAGKDCLENGTTSAIGSNHGHSVVVSKNDVIAGVEKVYNIKGTSGHSHSITVTANNFDSLKNNQQIQVSSSNDSSHTHLVKITCA